MGGDLIDKLATGARPGACIAAVVATLAMASASAASVSPYPDAVGRVEFDGGSCTDVVIVSLA